MFSGKDLWKALSRDSTQEVWYLLNYYLLIQMYFVSIHPCLEQRSLYETKRNETKRNETKRNEISETKGNETGFKHSQNGIDYLIG